MKNFFKILGLVLLIAGSALCYFSTVPVADGIGIAVTALALYVVFVRIMVNNEVTYIPHSSVAILRVYQSIN